MQNSQKTRVALVTGGGSGLGRAFCCRLATENWHTVVADIDTASAQQTVEQILKQGGTAQAEQLDVSDRQGWQALVDRLKQDLPRLDLLINNAGICSSEKLGTGSLDQVLKTIDINLHGTILGCHTTIPWLSENTDPAHIVNIASIFGVVSPPATGAYNLSKAAVISLSETLAIELQPQQIGLTVVMPGFFQSCLLDQASFETEAQKKLALKLMQNAQITADDVVDRTLRAVDRNETYVVLGSKARWYWRIKRYLPNTFLRMMARKNRRYNSKHDSSD